jgi:hypothetical protein
MLGRHLDVSEISLKSQRLAKTGVCEGHRNLSPGSGIDEALGSIPSIYYRGDDTKAVGEPIKC